MSLLQNITEFFQSIFMSSSPDVKKRQDIKKIENELKELHVCIYKNELIQPNLAEALRIMYINTKVIDDVLANTICSEDVQRNNHFAEQLLLTGFDSNTQDTLESFSIDQMKNDVVNYPSLSTFFEKKHRELESIIKQLNTSDFLKIDATIERLHQLSDICKYSYVTTMRLFDVNFSSSLSYRPSFEPIPPDLLETPMMDLYYVTTDMQISTTIAKAVIALAELYNHGSLPENKRQEIQESLEKIQSVLKHVFTSEILLNIIRIAKKTPDFTPQHAQYHGNARQKYADYLEAHFVANENRLKVEIKDDTIKSEVGTLFADQEMEELLGYNETLNMQLKQNSPSSFIWVTPIQVVKTFLHVYYNEQVKTLLNDIVIEGFFNNPAYKSEFSASVYACNDASQRVEAFEQKFARGGEFDEAIISSLIRDSHKDADFTLKIKDMIEQINRQAKNIIQAEATNVYDLYTKIGELLIDSKKPTPDSISNLKVLMGSSRNRDNSSMLEQQFGQWKIFLEIMKNYAIIGNIEINT